MATSFTHRSHARVLLEVGGSLKASALFPQCGQHPRRQYRPSAREGSEEVVVLMAACFGFDRLIEPRDCPSGGTKLFDQGLDPQNVGRDYPKVVSERQR